jgi:hypothetical protein
MNKKFVALLIPLMILPMVSFGAAHWYDYITKQYKMHVGTVCVELTKWHVNETTAYDVNCNNILWGDELTITNLYGTCPCTQASRVVGVQILANPIFPCWEVTLDMYIKNCGTLALKVDPANITFGGPYATEPDYGPIVDPVPIPDYFQYWHKYYVQVSGVWVEKEPTTFSLKAGETMWVREYIHFIGQKYPELQCHWFRLDFKIPFYEFVPSATGSYTWEKPQAATHG